MRSADPIVSSVPGRPAHPRRNLRLALVLGVLLLVADSAHARLWPRAVESALAIADRSPEECGLATLLSLAVQANGDFLAGWTADHRAVVRAYSAEGEPLGPEHAFLPAAGDRQEWESRLVTVAAADDGTYLATWFRSVGSSSDGAVAWSFLDATGRPTGGGVPIPVSYPSVPQIAALPDGSVLLAWLDRPADRLVLNAQRFSRHGPAQGPRRSVDLDGDGPRFPFIELAVGADGGFLVTTETGLVAFAPDGTPRGPGRALRPAARSAAVTALPGGGYLAAWVESADDPAVLVQRLDRDGVPLASARSIGSAVTGTVFDNPTHRSGPAIVRSGERVLVAWTAGTVDEDEGSRAPRVVARELDLLGEPVGAPEPLHAPLEQLPPVIARGSIAAPFGPVLAATEWGRVVAGWHVDAHPEDFDPCDLGRAVLVRAFDDFEAAAPPPPGTWLRPAALPGFEIQVRIGGAGGTGGGTAGTEGALEADCLAATACFSGALPGRTEVLARVIGPRPNGSLWPVLMRLSTSTVEAWIRPVAAADSEEATRYYRLDGARPGTSDLTGLFDRLGFPHRSVHGQCGPAGDHEALDRRLHRSLDARQQPQPGLGSGMGLARRHPLGQEHRELR